MRDSSERRGVAGFGAAGAMAAVLGAPLSERTGLEDVDFDMDSAIGMVLTQGEISTGPGPISGFAVPAEGL